jgi:hypothetical protein
VRLVLAAALVAGPAACGGDDALDEPWPPPDARTCLDHRHPMALPDRASRLATRGTRTVQTGRTATVYFCFFRPGSAEHSAHLAVRVTGIVARAEADRIDVPGEAYQGFVIPVSVTIADGDGTGGVSIELTYPPGTSTVDAAGVQISVHGDRVLIEEFRRDRPPATW